MNVGWDEVCDLGVNGDGGVEQSDLKAGGFGFGKGLAGVLFVEQDLTLEVGGFDEVSVDQREGADACSGEQGGSGGSGGSNTDDGYVSGGEELLTGVADAGEENLARVAILIGDR